MHDDIEEGRSEPSGGDGPWRTPSWFGGATLISVIFHVPHHLFPTPVGPLVHKTREGERLVYTRAESLCPSVLHGIPPSSAVEPMGKAAL